MAAGVEARLGTPFFTSKDNGTGLGLSVCYNMAVRYNASIQLDTGSRNNLLYLLFVTRYAQCLVFETGTRQYQRDIRHGAKNQGRAIALPWF